MKRKVVSGIFVLMVFMFVFALWQREGMEAQLLKLEATGFRADLRVERNPLVLVDSRRAELALVWNDRYRRLPLKEIIAADWDPMAGGRNEPRPELRLRFADPELPVLVLRGDDDSVLRLRDLLTRPE